MDCLKRLTRFQEGPYETTQGKLSVVDGRLHTAEKGLGHAVGRLTLPSLAGLRHEAADARLPGCLRLAIVEATSGRCTATPRTPEPCSRSPHSSTCWKWSDPRKRRKPASRVISTTVRRDPPAPWRRARRLSSATISCRSPGASGRRRRVRSTGWRISDASSCGVPARRPRRSGPCETATPCLRSRGWRS